MFQQSIFFLIALNPFNISSLSALSKEKLQQLFFLLFSKISNKFAGLIAYKDARKINVSKSFQLSYVPKVCPARDFSGNC
jgi:hypothetical protein